MVDSGTQSNITSIYQKLAEKMTDHNIWGSP
jgi:hypothetical protein